MSERYTYLTCSKKLRYRILRGYYKPGEMLPSIRILAKQEKYNPATVRRSLEPLILDGLITCKGTFGFQVKDDSALIGNERRKEAHIALNQLISGLTALGLSKQDILLLIHKAMGSMKAKSSVGIRNCTAGLG